MPEPVHFHTDLYRRDAVHLAAEKYRGQASFDFTDSGSHIIAQLDPLSAVDRRNLQALLDEFCNDALSETVMRLRAHGGAEARQGEQSAAAPTEPPWELLAPFGEGAELGLGWVLESLSPVRTGAATLVLRHPESGVARVAIRRNSGAPLGVAHTEQLDFMLMNGGSGTARTEHSLERILVGLAAVLRERDQRRGGAASAPLAALQPHAEPHTAQAAPGARGAAHAAQVCKRIAPTIDLEGGAVSFEFEEAGIGRLALYDAVLGFAARCFVFLRRGDANRIVLQLKPRADTSADALRTLARDVTKALNQVARRTTGTGPTTAMGRDGLPLLQPRRVDMDALLAELAAADPIRAGLGFQAERGPGHENLRVLNIRGTGACNSECLFCIEKFNPTHRPMLKADATRDLIVESGGNFDMLFFAAGEPTIHPKLFEYVELAKSVGFSCFGMSSHFRTFADPHFALKTLQAGFEYFDIALHAADPTTQLDVNPIGDDGDSLFEALKGLANLQRLADVLAVRISITHKIVVSRLNVLHLEAIFRATYDRGVRHFILQPVRTLGLEPAHQAKLEISEDEIMPHLNELLRRTEGLGAVVKPYGFSRQSLFAGSHVEQEQNRVKNIYGKSRSGPAERRVLPTTLEERPTDGRHWVEVRALPEDRYGFAADGSTPVLDDGLRRGMDLPFGCRMGSCGMCCAVLVEGAVDQSTQIFLSEEQVRQGYVLMCQARPLSDVVLRVCTDDEIDQL